MMHSRRLTITHPLHAFGVTWAGQLMSLLGSGLVTFGIDIEVYKRTGSITWFTLLTFFYYLPMLVLSPLAGTLVDRWDRRRAMLLSDLGAGGSTLCLWLMLFTSDAGLWTMQPWHFCIPFALSATFNALRWPAFITATALLVPKQHLGRANGLLELANGLGQVAPPALAGFLLGRIGLRGIVLIDLASFVIAVLTLLLVRFPQPPPVEADSASKRSLWQEMGYGWSFIQARPGLRGLMLFAVPANLILSMVMVLSTPLILSFTDESTAGIIQSISGLGMLVGGVMMSAWGGPRRRITGVIGFHVLAGLALLVAGLPPTPLIVTLGASLFLFTMPPIMSCSQTIWQSKVAVGEQGRIFAVRRMITLSSPPVASLLAGPLAERYFEPWMAPGGALASTVGRVIGTGPGRGIGFLYVVLGGLTLVNALVLWLYPRTRLVEDELPDALQDTPPRYLEQEPVLSEEAQPNSSPALAAASGEPRP
jgi:MFS transporter, DHA3 family, macrolide efflux protein